MKRTMTGLAILAFGLGASGLLAGSVDTGPPSPQKNASADAVEPETSQARPAVSPARGIEHRPGRGAGPDSAPVEEWIRSITGRGNNVVDVGMGATYTPLLRMADADYSDGVSAMAGIERASARDVSNSVCAQSRSMLNRFRATDYLWQWGQFVDHDIDLTEGADPPEPAPIVVPPGDPFFDPHGLGGVTIGFNRSIWDPGTGTDPSNPREQLNEITAWIDASNVYGSDAERANALRTLDGTGKLRTSEGELLPFNDLGLPNAGGSDPTLFLAGDVRANEQVALTAMHTLFVREHNRIAEDLAQRHPNRSGEQIYQKARQLVGAEMQAITYREFLPALLGRHALSPYRGYRPNVDARIMNVFSTASYRFGHSALSVSLLRLDSAGDEIVEGHLPLRYAFFNPTAIIEQGGIEPLLRGLAAQACQTIDPFIVDEVRNFLFGAPGSGGFDLAALNIQRGRDHGLPDYNGMRSALGLTPAKKWNEISSSRAIQARLARVYPTVDDVDLWVGALAEDALATSHVGELNLTVIRLQFEALRDGDRLWYEQVLSPDDRRMVEESTLATVIRRNTSIGNEIPDNVFRLPGRSHPPRGNATHPHRPE